MRTNRYSTILVAITLIATALVGAYQTSSGVDGDHTTRMYTLLAQQRYETTRTVLTVDEQLAGFAQDWAEQLAAAEGIAHRPELGDTAWNYGLRFAVIGENVGEGDSVDDIVAAFMASPSHRDNIEHSDWTRIGVGVATSSTGRLYIVVNYADGPAQPTTGTPR